MSKDKPKWSKTYAVHMILGQYSQEIQLSGDISSSSSHQHNSTISRTVFSPYLAVVEKIPWRHRSPAKNKARRTLESSSTRWDWKVGSGGPYKEGKRKPFPFIGWSWNKAEHWRIRPLKESAHMVSRIDQLSRSSIEINTIWEPIIKKVRLKNNNKEENNSLKTLTDKNHQIKLLIMLLG